MNKSVKKILSASAIGMLVCLSSGVRAQKIALKTNALEWLCLSPNAGLETRLSKHFSLNLEASGSVAKFDDKRFRHFTFRPELRYWFSGRMQTHHFVGLMPIGTAYDIKLNDTRHKGWGLGMGATYGYSLVLSKHFSVEGTVGAGLLNYEEKKYSKTENGEKVYKKTALCPLKLGISAVYVF